MLETNRKCKYCGANLKAEYINYQGMCFYCDNDACKVKPITEYNYASSEAFKEDVNGIVSNKMRRGTGCLI